VSETDDFASEARHYCAFVDNTEALGRDDLILQLQDHLIRLYSAALRLPAGEPSESDVPEVKHDEWVALDKRLTLQLGDFDYYSLIFDPYEPDSASVVGSLADDIASIYQDLQDGLAMIEKSSVAAAWEWRESFKTHWGRHLTHALYAVFSLTHPGSVRSIRQLQ
jgi:hypothetical protein